MLRDNCTKGGKKPSFEGLPNPETVKNGCGSGSRTCYFEKMNLNRKNYIPEPINRGSLNKEALNV